MIPKNMSAEQFSQCKDLIAKIKTSFIADTPPSFSLSAIWTLLSDSEKVLVDLMSVPSIQPPITQEGDPEFGLVLYHISTYNGGSWTYQIIYDLLCVLGYPGTNISTNDYNNYENTLSTGPGVVAGDGTYLSTVPYATFDENWGLAAVDYLLLLIGGAGFTGDIGKLISILKSIDLIPTMYPFVTSANALIPTPPLNTAGTLTVAVFGDWGAADANAQQTLAAMATLNPDIYLHLGDVYYCGLSIEEINNLIKPLQNTSGLNGIKLTLNSNHEMYNGGNGYFGTALTNKIFSSQNGASYFAIEFENFVLLGLDSAYFDNQYTQYDLYMYGALYDPTVGSTNPQVAFVNSLNLTNKQVVVFTHHNGISLDGSTLNQPLFNQLNTVLGCNPDFWYYGHIHDGVVYSNAPALNGIKAQTGNTPLLRCFGNAALPYGIPYFLQNPTPPGITYCAQTNAGNSNVQLSDTIRNGFALLTFTNGQIVETFYEVDINNSQPISMGSLTTSFTSSTSKK